MYFIDQQSHFDSKNKNCEEKLIRGNLHLFSLHSDHVYVFSADTFRTFLSHKNNFADFEFFGFGLRSLLKVVI